MLSDTRYKVYMKPKAGSLCQEASDASHKTYIACAKPAEFVIEAANGTEVYNMCRECAYHNVGNRNARCVEKGEKIKITEIKAEPVDQKKHLRDTAAAMAAEAAQAPTDPVPPLSKLEGVHQAGRPVEAAYIKFNIAVREALKEIKDKGDRAAHLVQLYSRLRTAQDILAEQIKDFQAVLGLLGEVALPEAFEREKLQTLTTQDGDRMTITQKMFASILAEMREAAYEWLRKNGHGAMITETVNSSSLSAFAKAELAEGRELPETIFTIHTKPSASLTRAKKK